MRHSTLRTWVQARVESVVPDKDPATDWQYVDDVSSLGTKITRGHLRHYDLRWGESSPNWIDGTKAPHRLATIRQGEIRILYPVARNRLSDVEDMACDDADLVVAALKDSANRLTETSDGAHARTQAQHTGLERRGADTETSVLVTIQVQIEHRRKRSPLGA